MATLYDLLPDSSKAAFPRETLTPKWQQRLSLEVPPDYPPEYAAEISSELAKRAPRMTVVHEKVQAVRKAMSGRAAPIAGPTQDFRGGAPIARLPGAAVQSTEEAYPGLPAWQRVGLRLANAVQPTAAGLGDLAVHLTNPQAPRDVISSQVAPLVPPAKPWTKGGVGEHLTDIVGGLIPYVAGAELGGIPGLAAAAAAPPGTDVQRLVRAGTTAAAAGVSGAVTPAIAGEAPGFARTLASHVPGAALFGAQPWAAAKISEALGQPAEGIKADDIIRSGLEQFLISGVLHEAGRLPGMVAEAGARGAESARVAEMQGQLRRGVVPPAEAARQAALGIKPRVGERPDITPQEELLAEAARAPKGMDYKARNTSEQMSKRLNETLGGKVLRVNDPDTGKELAAKVHSIHVYRFGDPEAGARHVRVIAEDASGHLAPLHYKTVEDFARAVKGPYEAPTRPAKPAEAPAPAPTEKPAPAAPAAVEPLPTTYKSSSKGEIPINRMASDHLKNAHAKAPEGPERRALAAEMVRRGVTPKPGKAPEPQPELKLVPGEGRPKTEIPKATEPVVTKPIPPPPTATAQPKLELNRGLLGEVAKPKKETRLNPKNETLAQAYADHLTGKGRLKGIELRTLKDTIDLLPSWDRGNVYKRARELAAPVMAKATETPPQEAPKAPETPKRTGEPTDADIEAALEKHHPGGLAALADKEMSDEELDAAVHAALKADNWDVGGEEIAKLKQETGRVVVSGKGPVEHLGGKKPFTSPENDIVSPEERDAVMAINGKTSAEALAAVDQHGSESQRMVAARVRALVRDAGRIDTPVNFIFKDTPLNDVLKMIPRGIRDKFPQAQLVDTADEISGMADDPHTRGVIMYGHGMKPGQVFIIHNGELAQRRNIPLSTVLHEQYHLATTPLLEWAQEKLVFDPGYVGVTAREQTVLTAYKDLHRLLKHVDKEARARLRRGELTDEQRAVLRGNALLNVKELVTWASSDARFQRLLETIYYKAHKNAFTGFVNAMRRVLGMAPGQETALTEALRVSDQLLAEKQIGKGKAENQLNLEFEQTGPGGPRFATEDLRKRLKVKRKLEQVEMEGLGALSKGDAAIAKHIFDVSDKAVQQMLTETDNFDDKFRELVRNPMNRETAPITLAEEAARELGMKVPEDFDPNLEVSRMRAKALAEAGQGDVFAAAGVEIPKPKARAEEKQTVKGVAEDAAAQTVDDAGAEHLAPPEMKRVKVSDLSILPAFQKREGVTESDLVNPRVVQQHLEPSPKNPEGGYSQALIDQSPVTIWKDTNGAFGEKGKTYVLDGHHRKFLASHTFGKKGEEYVVTGKADRQMNAVEVFTSPEEAQRIAEYANRRTARTSYLEDAKLASRLQDEGKSVKEIAAALGTKQSEAERAAHIGKLDPSVREFFSDEALRIHGGHLGKAVAAHPDYFNAIRQRQVMREINDGQHGSAIELAAALKQEQGLLDRLQQLDMGNDFGNAGFTPQQVKEATNRGLRYVERIKDALTKQLSALKAIEKAGGDPAAVKLLHDKVSADKERAKALEKTLDPHALFDRIAKGLRAGVPAEKTLEFVKAEIDLKLGPESPADQIPAGSSPQILRDFENWHPDDRALAEHGVPMLWMDILRGTPGAVRAGIRRIPRGERLRTIDAQGRTVENYDGKSLYEPDYYSESALVRLMAHAKLLGGNFVLPRDNAIDLKAGYSDEALHMHRWNWRRMQLFGDEAARLMGPFSDNAKLVSRVLSGREKPGALPKELRHVPDAIRTLTKEIFDRVNDVRKSIGLEPVKPLQGYDLPHMITGRASELVDSLLQSFLGGVDAKQRKKALEEMRNRFFEHRNQNERWTEDAALQIDAYISVMSRYAALAPVLKRLGGDIARMENEDPIRAGLVADWLKATLLRRKSKIDNILDNTARTLFYAKNDPAPEEISARRAAEILFPDRDSRLSSYGLRKAHKRFFIVPEGVDYEAPPGRRPDIMGKPTEGSLLLHTDKFGRKLIGTQGEEVFTNVAAPKLRWPFEVAGKAAIEVGHAASEAVQKASLGKIKTRPEGMTGAQSKEAMYREWRQRIADGARSPGAAWFAMMGGNQMRAVLGYNFGAMIANWGQPWLTSAPEYGFLPVLQGTGRVAGGAMMRALTDHGERLGYLTKDNAAKWREVFQDTKQRAMQIGSLQGEVMSAREQLAHPTLEVYQQIAKVLGPMYGYRVIEDFTRGVNVLGAEAMAKRYGLDPAVAWKFHSEMNGDFFKDWAESVARMRQKGTTERLQSIMDSETMFDYNALGQAPIFGGTAGKLFGRLMTFPANYFPRYVSRPIGGAAKVVAAVARGVVGKEAAPRPVRALTRLHATRTESKYVVRGEYPAPMKAAERWLERHGARYHDRQAAKVFLAQALTVGAMQGITQLTGVNALLPGTPGWDVLVTLLAYSLDPNNPNLRRALERARKAAIISPERGVEIGQSPVLRLLVKQFGEENSGMAFARAQKRAKQGRPLEAAGEFMRPGGDFLAEYLREQVPGMVALRRAIQNSVEMGPIPSSEEISRTALPEVIGTRSYVKNPDVGAMVSGNLRLTPPDVEAKRRKVIKRKF